MSNPVSENIRNNLFHSLPAVEAAAPALVAGIAASLARCGGEPAPSAGARTIATLLVDMLIGQARHLIEGRTPQDIGQIESAHRAQGIEGRHYSRFGDALIPALKDALGPRLPGEMASAWCDAFWLVIRLVLQEPRQRPAARGTDDEGTRDRERLEAEAQR